MKVKKEVINNDLIQICGGNLKIYPSRIKKKMYGSVENLKTVIPSEAKPSRGICF